MTILSFQGKNEPELYLEWERKVELLFDCHNYSELKKVKLAAIKFADYTLVWWDQLITSRRRNGEPHIQTWQEMKVVMRKRFLPSHYYREQFNKLQNLKQGSRSVDEYYKEMEVAMIRANVVEDREATMARFLARLHWDIRDKVELQHYVELEDMVHMAIKIENQLKRRGSSGGTQRSTFSSGGNQRSTFSSGGNQRSTFSSGGNQKSNFSSGGNQRSTFSSGGNQRQSQSTPSSGGNQSQRQSSFSSGGNQNQSQSSFSSGSNQRQSQSSRGPKAANQGTTVVPEGRNRDKKCFKCQGFGHIMSECPNRRIMIIRDDGDVVTDGEETDPKMPDLEDPDEEEYEELFAPNKQLFIARGASSVQTQPDEREQRENLFHTRCFVQDKVCSVIIEGGSYTNVASKSMVEKLGLAEVKHPKPYRLQWLNETGVVKVTKKVNLPICIGRYEDEVLCDVISMQASHILLGRPWQFDRRVTHDGFTNKYSFEYKHKKVSLVPLSPKQVYEDQVQLQKEADKVKRKEQLVGSKGEFVDVFPDETLHGLPPIREIEHQIDFVPEATLPNRPAYRTNSEETKELERFIVVYFDDILIYSKHHDDHVDHLRSVMDVLRKGKLFANLKKCTFCTDKLVLLGFFVSAQGVQVDEEKIRAIQEWPTPKNIGEVRSFHELASFYRRFVPHFNNVAAPLTEVIKKNVEFEWGKAQEEAFALLKYKLTHTPILSLPNFQKLLRLNVMLLVLGLVQF
ncbi:uncharacterized protein LOC131000309 [Salvia miltiorrhiza]|uniref:uncharacterized protein LOC131000309 n=1 Tax=Salvia miltiorrhiza TaxID=226208 RepID=UPI0025AD1419|nr:uncharacterized protein LOC131000309 [Salvia miltiorrhiza]